MSVITLRRYSGCSNIYNQKGLATDLQDVADDLAALKAGTIAAAAAAVTAVADSAATAVADSVVTAVADSVAIVTADAVVTTEAAVAATAGVCDGLVAGAPTTPSSQAVDPGGETDWNINISAGYIFVNSVGGYFAAQVDFDVSSAVKILDIGEAMYTWLVGAEAAGTVTQEVVLGTAATSGTETIPDDAAITAGIGHANWSKIALLHAHRSADAVVTTTENVSYMTKWGGGAAALANDLKAKYDAAVTLLNEAKTTANANQALAVDLKAKYNAAVSLINALKTLANANQALAVDVKAKYNAAVTLLNEIRDDLNTAASITIKTTKG